MACINRVVPRFANSVGRITRGVRRVIIQLAVSVVLGSEPDVLASMISAGGVNGGKRPCVSQHLCRQAVVTHRP